MDRFETAAREAAKAFCGAKLRRSCVDGPTTAIVDLLLSPDAEVGPAERRTLARLLSGRFNETGRPATKRTTRQTDMELINDARRWRDDLRQSGMKAVDAEWEAAERAARDPRSRGRSPSTLRGEMQRKPKVKTQ